jgi:hypothetical protein
MVLVRPTEVEARPYAGQRGKGLQYLEMLHGNADLPDNYEFNIVQWLDSSFSPRHHHNFDQLRYPLKGAMEYAPDKEIPEGNVGYFPEGSYYGPFNIPKGNEVLMLQFGGASGHGYLAWDELRRGTQELERKGSFERGVFTSVDDEGKRHNKDGYEAVWEYMHGRPIQYPAPRYRDAVIIDPEAFAWMPIDDVPNVSERNLGVFNERGTGAFQLLIEPGSTYPTPLAKQTVLLFVLDGSVTVDGGEPCPPRTALEIVRGKSAKLSAPKGQAKLLGYRLPRF